MATWCFTFASLGSVMTIYIGPGAKIYGEITIASNIKIAPNAAVSKDFLMENVIIGGVPAKQISKSK